jgi:hypothetical protein
MGDLLMRMLKRNEANSKMARLNIAYHIGNMAKREKISFEQAVTNFLTNISTGKASPYLIGAYKIADPKNLYPTRTALLKWVKEWSKNIPEGQKRKPRIDKNRTAKARKQIIEFILLYRKKHRWSLAKEIHHFLERLRFDRLPPYMKEAAIHAHGKPGSARDKMLKRSTIYKWIKMYEKAGYDIEALKPKHREKPVMPHANDNSNPKTVR